MGKQSKLSRHKRTEQQKAVASRQPRITEQNQARKREKHMRNHPADLQTLDKFVDAAEGLRDKGLDF